MWTKVDLIKLFTEPITKDFLIEVGFDIDEFRAVYRDSSEGHIIELNYEITEVGTFDLIIDGEYMANVDNIYSLNWLIDNIDRTIKFFRKYNFHLPIPY